MATPMGERLETTTGKRMGRKMATTSVQKMATPMGEGLETTTGKRMGRKMATTSVLATDQSLAVRSGCSMEYETASWKARASGFQMAEVMAHSMGGLRVRARRLVVELELRSVPQSWSGLD